MCSQSIFEETFFINLTLFLEVTILNLVPAHTWHIHLTTHLKRTKLHTLVMSSLPDSNNICNPRVAITDAKTTIPWKYCSRSFQTINHINVKNIAHKQDILVYVLPFKLLILEETVRRHKGIIQIYKHKLVIRHLFLFFLGS